MVKVLMAVDGSDHDMKTARFLGKLFHGVPDIEVTTLHIAHLQIPPVATIGPTPAMPSPQEVERWQGEIQAQARAIVARAEAELGQVGVRTRTQVVWGSPADAIVRVAEESAYDLIAMGSRAAGQVAGIFLGSVSDRVAHRAKTPVLIVR